jgi:Tol biopolymer transport system component
MTIRTRRRASVAALVLGVAAVAAATGLAAAPSSAAPKPRPVRLASVSTGGALAIADAGGAAISADGKYVAFFSSASNLVPGDTNGLEDVFVRDLTRGLTRRATQDTPGEEAVGRSGFRPALSKDGRYVLFTSDAGNLVPDDSNHVLDAFVRDLRYGITMRVSLDADDAQFAEHTIGGGISGNGRFVVFHTACACIHNTVGDVYVRDLKKGTTRLVSVASDGTPADQPSSDATISGDGRYVAFQSAASNLVPGDTNGTTDVFRHDLKTGITIRVSVGPGERQSTGGRPGASAPNVPTPVPIGSTGPSLSTDGNRIAFFSFADGLVDGPHGTGDVYVRDVAAGTTTLVSGGMGGAANDAGPDAPPLTPSISGDGRRVGFVSFATNLVAGDTNGEGDGFVRDLATGEIWRVTTGAGGEGDLAVDGIALDREGEDIAFTSAATNLVAGDTNGHRDVFVTVLKR